MHVRTALQIAQVPPLFDIMQRTEDSSPNHQTDDYEFNRFDEGAIRYGECVDIAEDDEYDEEEYDEEEYDEYNTDEDNKYDNDNDEYQDNDNEESVERLLTTSTNTFSSIKIRRSRRYMLKLVPGYELEELETWSQRTRACYNWRLIPIQGGWEAQIIIDGRCIENVSGKGVDQWEAKLDAVRKLNVAEPPILKI
ncbi:hypothetical protein FRC09_007256 [Ceratobasidium sp. 395]|nr:hypothetical protein FRC09_007256 [Ceratobasidium sp. 395]